MKRVYDLLKKNFVMTVATSHADKPRASVVEYYIVNDAIIFATATDSIKANNLAHNKNISVSINNLPLFVTLDGTVTTPTDAEINSYNEQLLNKHPEFKDLIEKGLFHPFSYYKVDIQTAYYNDYTQGMKPTEIIEA